MKKIYALDAWILFAIFLIPVILQNTDIGEILGLVILLAGLIWYYKVTIDLFKKLPGGHAMNLNIFKVHFFFPLSYFALVIITMGGYSINEDNMGEYGVLGPILFICHLFATYGIFYCMYFTAKALISVFDNNKNPEWNLYIGYFFAFWFLPIGIWFLQPKIKKLLVD